LVFGLLLVLLCVLLFLGVWLVVVEFEALLAGKSEFEIWGEETELPPAERPELPGTVTREREPGKRQFPRPGLAGGAAELRGLDLPEKPDLA
jgi:cell division protease FtsH